MPTYRDYFADIKKRIHEATPEQVQELWPTNATGRAHTVT